ncbi:hypothetical protein GT043_17905 [Streptomyces sp. SID2131]|nr:hypothetical protein [Streptomyces sp. SID2131]
MIFLIPVAFLAAFGLVVFFLLQSLGAVLPGNERWAGWRRPVVAAAFACAATATASYSLGAIGLMSTVAVAQDGGADSAPFPYDHPCRSELRGAVGYHVHFLTLRTVCVMEDGERKAVQDVPQEIRMTAAASVAGTAVLAGVAWAVRPRVSVRA